MGRNANYINNIEEMLKGVDWELADDEFYTAQIVKRRKDAGNEDLQRSEKYIKTYIVHTKEALVDLFESEIIPICNAINARCYFCPRKKSLSSSMKLINHDVAQINNNKSFSKIVGLSSSVLFRGNSEGSKRVFVTDFDTNAHGWLIEKGRVLQLFHNYINVSYFCVDTPNGFHIVSEPYNIDDYNKHRSKLNCIVINPSDIKKNVTALLYCPIINITN